MAEMSQISGGQNVNLTTAEIKAIYDAEQPGRPRIRFHKSPRHRFVFERVNETRSHHIAVGFFIDGCQIARGSALTSLALLTVL